MQAKLLINGELVTGDGPAQAIRDPATGEEIACIPEASPEQVDAATRGAEEAFESFGRTTPAERAALVARACRRIETSETPPRLDELATEVDMSAFHFHRLFKMETGLTPRAYRKAAKIRAKSMISPAAPQGTRAS